MSDFKKNKDDRIPATQSEIKNWMLPQFDNSNLDNANFVKKLCAKQYTQLSQVSVKQSDASYQDGFTQGYQAGNKQASQEINKNMESLLKLIKDLCVLREDHKSNMVESIKKNAYQFLRLVSEKIIYHKLSESTDHIERVLQESLNKIEGSKDNIVIHCNLFTKEILKAALSKENLVIEIEQNQEMADYHFYIENQEQHIEYNIEKAVDSFLEEYKRINN